MIEAQGPQTPPENPCDRCEGCRQLADTEAREPWTAWTSLPVASSLAVLLGAVKPIPCDACDGSGEAPTPPVDSHHWGVTQTITVNDGSGRQGNCLQAAVASLLDLQLDDVPHFVELKSSWWELMETFAREHGYEVFLEDSDKPTEFGFAFGPSSRGVAHAVVHRGSEVWDPHPERTGLESVSAFVHLRPIADEVTA